MNLPPLSSPANLEASFTRAKPADNNQTWQIEKCADVICKSDILGVDAVQLRDYTMNFLKVLIGCSHRFSWPRIDDNGCHYQICADCGTAYEYDWKMMKRTEHLLVTPIMTRMTHGSHATS